MTLPITDEISAHVMPNLRGVVYEELGHLKSARTELEKLYAEAPD